MKLKLRNLSKASLDVGVLGLGVRELVLGAVESTELASGGSNEGLAVGAVSGSLPVHGTTESLLGDVVDLGGDDISGVERDELLSSRVVRVAANNLVIALDGGTSLGESLVVPDTVLPRSRANTAVSLTDSGGGLEGTTIDGETEDDLVGGDTGSEVSSDGIVGVEGGGVGVA